MKTKIKQRISELEKEHEKAFKDSISKDTHILMRVHFRNIASELKRVIVELKGLLN